MKRGLVLYYVWSLAFIHSLCVLREQSLRRPSDALLYTPPTLLTTHADARRPSDALHYTLPALSTTRSAVSLLDARFPYTLPVTPYDMAHARSPGAKRQRSFKLKEAVLILPDRDEECRDVAPA